MFIIISPAKSLYDHSPIHFEKFTVPEFMDETEKIVSVMRKKKPAQLAQLMDISPKLAALNFQRYQDWSPIYTPENSWQAILMFNVSAFIP